MPHDAELREALAALRASLGRSVRPAANLAPRAGPAEDAAFAPPRRRSYDFSGFHLEAAGHRLRTPCGGMLLLTRSESLILTALLEQAGRTVGREALKARLKAGDVEAHSRAVDLHISRLRAKMRGYAERDPIRTIRGLGYRLEGPASATQL